MDLINTQAGYAQNGAQTACNSIQNCYPYQGYQTGILSGYCQMSSATYYPYKFRPVANGFILEANSCEYCFQTIDQMTKFIQDFFKKEKK